MQEKSIYNGNKENVTKRHPRCFNRCNEDFPGGPAVKNPPANAGETDLTPGLGRLHKPQSNEASAQLDLCSATTEACPATARTLQQEKPRQ